MRNPLHFLKSLETLSVNFVDTYIDGFPWHGNLSHCYQ